jgi:hypothetical protein
MDRVSDSDELAAFVQETGRVLDVAGTVEEFGVSRILACTVRERAVRIGTNGASYWVTADLAWEMPRDVGIMWAPAETYKRLKLFEMEEGPPRTGHDAFDQVYVVVGVGSAGWTFAPLLARAVLEALLEHADVRPEISWLDPRLHWQLHVKSHPPLQQDESVTDSPSLGLELFTPAHAARAALRTVRLAERIESRD